MVVLFTFLQAQGKHTGYCTTPNPDSCVTGHLYVPTGPSGDAVADAYELVARSLTGDGTITARLTSLSGRISAGPADAAPSLADTRPGVADWARAGLMITTRTTQGAPYAAVMATGGHGMRFQYDYSHDDAGLPGAVSAAAPRWLRLTRRGETITGYDSRDGDSWRRIGSARLGGRPRTVSAGVFATSPTTAAGQASQATAFDRVAIDGAASPGRWRGANIGTGPRAFYTTLGHGGYSRAGDSVTVTGSGDIAPAAQSAGGDTASASLLFGLAVALIVIGTLLRDTAVSTGVMRIAGACDLWPTRLRLWDELRAGRFIPAAD
jgi:hypothetical protein